MFIRNKKYINNIKIYIKKQYLYYAFNLFLLLNNNINKSFYSKSTKYDYNKIINYYVISYKPMLTFCCAYSSNFESTLRFLFLSIPSLSLSFRKLYHFL